MALVPLAFASSVAAQTVETETAAVATAAPIESFPRPRLGLGLGVGVGTREYGASASLRGGVQLNSEFSVSYQLSAVADFTWSNGEAWWLSHAALVEYVPRDAQWIVLGLGPSITQGARLGGWSGSLPFGGGQSSWGSKPSEDFVSPGLDARIAIVLGSRGTHARGGLSLELSAHASRHGVATTLGIGFDLY